MRKIIFPAAIALLLCALAACGGGATPPAPAVEPPAESLTGETSEILTAVIAGAGELLAAEPPPSFEAPVTTEDCQGMLGLTPEQFETYVTDAYASNAALLTNAHEIALVKCNDPAAAAEVKTLIAAGFDSGKWICVAPDESSVIDSGSYVLLTVTSEEYAEALIASFISLAANNTGEKSVFYTRPGPG
ncbi:MAG: DUF4358 domain-containing protein [Gracilibacteraceae bacterium]|jgi:hypothetical protein|nr:DUF4358 domain-containing protein [Gracilibacteraceae bacterium]